MKKILAMILTATCLLALTACGGTTDGGSQGGDGAAAPSYASAEEVLVKVWDAYGEDEKFPVFGGNSEAAVDGAPGAFDLSKTDEMASNMAVSAELAATIDDAATVYHAMNMNSFTAVVYHVEDVAAFEASYVEALKTNPWMCGAPEQYVLMDAGNGYAVVGYGAPDLVEVFAGHAAEVLEGATVVSEGSLFE